MKVYHFLSSEYALENLRYRRLKIAQFDDLNDPFELIAADSSERKQRTILNEWKVLQAEKYGVLCFSKTWRNPVLWSHYADRHKGICLGFEVADKLLTPVNYRKSRLNVDILSLFDQEKFDKSLTYKLLNTKFYDWKYEKEVRIVVKLKYKDKENGLYFCNFSEDIMLSDVIAGPLCNKSEKEIRGFIKNEDSSVNLIKSRLAFKTFDVVMNQRGFS
ncbi:MAG: DUF2971 domain-containing protein [Desulfobulbaceae bacterium]|nr:DUF2971 domain-containing protein [Desulfobulbaceae bacterium]